MPVHCGGLLLEERGDALGRIRRAEEADELAPLGLEPFGERAVQTVGDGALGGGQRQRSLGGVAPGDLTRGVEQRLGLDDPRDHAQLERARRVDGIAAEQQLHRRGATDQPRAAAACRPSRG